MIEIRRVNTDNEDLLVLIRALDNELLQTYGEGMKDYNPHNTLTSVQFVLVLYENDHPAACGCYRIIDTKSVEIKRMYVKPSSRGRGYSKLILAELEKSALQSGFTNAILETGNLQIPAMKVYESMGYKIIPNYGPYISLENSVCYSKQLAVFQQRT